MTKKETINWILNNIAIPLTPFFIGAFLRLVYTQKISMELFNESELALSMGLLCIIMIKSVNKLSDPTLADNLANVLVILAFTFIVIFACTSFLKFHLDIKTSDQLSAIINLSAKKSFGLTPEQIYTPQKDNFYNMLGVFRISVFVLTVITIPAVINFKRKHKLA